jgi:tetratricopeptide (TPR) repeat protein
VRVRAPDAEDLRTTRGMPVAARALMDFNARIAAALLLIGLSAPPAFAQRTAAQLADAGWRAVQQGDGDRAASAFGEALAMNPRDPVLNLGAGVAAQMQGRSHDASTHLQKALQLDPRLTQASTLLGEIAYRDGDLDLAIKSYESALAQQPANAEMRRRLEEWRNEASVHSGFATIKDERLSVMFEGPVERNLALRATTVLGNAFWTIGKTLGAYPNAPINVIFYSSQQFRDITGAPEWAGGGFDGQIRLPVRGALVTPDQFDSVLVHELTHAMLRQVAARNLPVWLNEGLAMYFEGDDPVAAERSMKRARLFIPLSNLRGSFTGLTGPQASLAYTESLFATAALLERISATGLGQLLQDMDRGQSIDEAIQQFGLTFAEFEQGLIQRIGRR